MDIILKSKDAAWIYTQHPGLKIDREKKEIIGDIFVNRSYNSIDLSGFFSIKIELYIRSNSFIPKVYETTNRLENIAHKLQISKLEDIHVNNDKSLCMVISDKEHECFENAFTLKEFFENCIEPYFYWIMYYEKYDKIPWNEYAHRELGFFERYEENGISYMELSKKLNRFEFRSYLLVDINALCLCGSNQKMFKCHKDVYNGLKKFQNIARLKDLKLSSEFNYPISKPISLFNIYKNIS